MRTVSADCEWAMFAHPHRDCIYDEAYLSVKLGKYSKLPVVEQAKSYRSVVPRHDGLFASGVIVRTEPPADGVMRANELWWAENVTWTPQCQVSLPYVLRKLDGCRPAVPWFEINRESRPPEREARGLDLIGERFAEQAGGAKDQD